MTSQLSELYEELILDHNRAPRNFEIFPLDDGRWTFVSAHLGEEVVRVEPFEELELRLTDLWINDSSSHPTAC